MRPFIFGGGRWIRTTEAFASDLQSDPFGRSGIPPKMAVYSLFSRILPITAGNTRITRRKMELARGVEPPTG
jgi:hypothetical protein